MRKTDGQHSGETVKQSLHYRQRRQNVRTMFENGTGSIQNVRDDGYVPQH